jgi:Dullard-like phosphatase family protein
VSKIYNPFRKNKRSSIISQMEVLGRTPSGSTITAISGLSGMSTLGDRMKFVPGLSKLSVVLDLDETLVHGSLSCPEWYDFEFSVDFGPSPVRVYVQERPGAREFLRSVAREFEVFIFTASRIEYAVPVVQHLLPCFPVERILTRPHCRFLNGFLVKDLTVFQRDLSRVVLVDNLRESFMLQPSNGVQISTWVGDRNDETLLSEVLPFLRLCSVVYDVRDLLGRELN